MPKPRCRAIGAETVPSDAPGAVLVGSAQAVKVLVRIASRRFTGRKALSVRVANELVPLIRPGEVPPLQVREAQADS